jgi:hypothetical protein
VLTPWAARTPLSISDSVDLLGHVIRVSHLPMSIAFSGLMELGDFWMIRKMLHGLRERAESGVAG